MPIKPPVPCRICGMVSVNGYCRTHDNYERAVISDYDKRRPSAPKRGYNRHHYKLRQMVLARQPLCSCGQPASEMHHIDGNAYNTAWSNLIAMCKSCHSRLTARGGR